MLRARQKIGKYRILGRISSGPLADVYRAYDTIQKQRVALKLPRSDAYCGHEEFLHEVQVATRLRHPNILSVLNASYIDDHFVIAMELGAESLADRTDRRISTARRGTIGVGVRRFISDTAQSSFTIERKSCLENGRSPGEVPPPSAITSRTSASTAA